MSALSKFVMPGIVEGVEFTDDGKGWFDVVHTTVKIDKDTGESKPVRVSRFEVMLANGAAKALKKLGIVPGTLMIFGCYGAEQASNPEGKVWPRLLATWGSILDPDSPEIVDGILAGFLGQDPTLKYTPAGTAHLDTSIALSRGVKQPDGTYLNITTWISMSQWGEQAERADASADNAAANGKVHMTKGALVQLQITDLHVGWYENGTKFSFNGNFNAYNVLRSANAVSEAPALPSGRRSSAAAAATVATATASSKPEAVSDDDIPF